MKFELWHAFVLGAVLSWGVYVPVLHEGQSALGEGRPSAGALRAFLCVGLAYFLTAVVIPLALFFTNLSGGEPLSFSQEGILNSRGLIYALLGGIAGAAGALCIILSIKSGGSPLYIAPLVFAGAPIMNSLVSLAWKTQRMPGPLFFVGIVLAAVGAGLVLYSKAELDRQVHAQKRNQAPGATAALSPNGTPSVPSQEARP
jgi:uncharacterized membrane protein